MRSTLRCQKENTTETLKATRRRFIATAVTTGAAVVLAQVIAFSAQAEKQGFDFTGFNAVSISSGLEARIVVGQDLRAVASAGAALNAGALDCATANADVASGASLIVNALETMTLTASGGGSLTTKGGGEILQQAASYGGLIVVQP